MSTNRYIDKLKARLAKEVDQRMQLQALLDDQVARNRALLAERYALKQLLAETRTSMIEAIHWEDLTPVRKRIETALQGEQP